MRGQGVMRLLPSQNDSKNYGRHTSLIPYLRLKPDLTLRSEPYRRDTPSIEKKVTSIWPQVAALIGWNCNFRCSNQDNPDSASVDCDQSSACWRFVCHLTLPKVIREFLKLNIPPFLEGGKDAFYAIFLKSVAFFVNEDAGISLWRPWRIFELPIEACTFKKIRRTYMGLILPWLAARHVLAHLSNQLLIRQNEIADIYFDIYYLPLM